MMEFFAGMFAFGTITFWMLILFEFCFLFYCVECVRGVLGIFSVLVAAAIFLFLGGIPIFSFLSELSMWSLLLYVGGYIGIAVAYSFLKWDRYCARASKKLKKALRDFANQKFPPNATETDEQLREDVLCGRIPEKHKESWYRITSCSGISSIPIASDNKNRIVTWMMFWPWSLAWTVLRDYVLELFDTIFEYLKMVYQKIANRHYKDLDSTLFGK